jgi:hypothetical protein
MSLYIRATRIKRKAIVPKVIYIVLGGVTGVLVAAVAAHVLQILQH